MKKPSVRNLLKTLPLIAPQDLLHELSPQGQKEYAELQSKLYLERKLNEPTATNTSL